MMSPFEVSYFETVFVQLLGMLHHLDQVGNFGKISISYNTNINEWSFFSPSIIH